MKRNLSLNTTIWFAFWLILMGTSGQAAERGPATVGGDHPRSVGPELVLQTGHTQPIRCLAVSPDGKYVVTGANDYAAVLWELASGRQLRRFTGHTAGLVSVAFSPDGKRVLTAGGQPDNSAIVWDLATGEKAASIQASKSDWLYAARFSPDGRQILTNIARESNVCALWDANTGALLRKFEPPDAQAVSINCDAVFSDDGRHVVTGGSRFKPQPSHGFVIIWDAATGRILRTLDGHQYEVTRIALNPQGTHAATASRGYDNGKDLFEVFLWDLATGKRLRDLEGHADYVNAIVFSPDGSRLVTTSDDRTAIVWDVETGKKVHVLNEKFSIYSSAFSPDGRQVFTAGRDDVVVAWDGATGRKLKTLERTAGEIRSVAFSKDCKQIAFEHFPGGIFLWETETGQTPRRICDHCGGSVMAFTPDGRFLLGGAHYGPSLWDVATGKAIYELKCHHPACGMTAMAFSADGQQLLTGGHGTRKSDGDSGESKWFSELLLSDTASGTRLRAFEGHVEGIMSAALSPDGKRVLSGERFGRIVLWDALTGRQLRVLQKKANSYANPVAFSPDSSKAAGGSEGDGIVLWDAASGKEIRTLPGHGARLSAVVFGADGRNLLTASENGSAVLWDAASGQKRQTFRATGGAILQVVFHPNGRHVLAQSEDGTVRVWDIRGGQELARAMHVGDKGDWLVVTPQGLFDGSEAARRQILFRVGGRLQVVPIDRFFQDFYRPGLLAEICTGRRPHPQVEFAKAAAPAVRIVSPDRGGKVQTMRVTLQVDVTDRGGGIRGPWLMQNGARVLAPGESRRAGPTLHRSLTLPLVTGENRLEVRAASADGSWESEPATITLVYEEPQVRPELHVLAVGINRYAQQSISLKYAVPDAQALAKVFQARGPALYGQGKVHVTTLVDEQATKRGIQAALDEAAKKAKAQDTMIVFLAGHGTTVGQRYYFIPHEFQNRAEKLEDDIQNQGIPGDVLGDGLGAVAALKRVLIFDTCQSGGNIALQRTARNPFAFRGALERLSRDQGVFTIAATAATAEAQEVPQLGHGLLSYALLAALGAVDAGPLEKQPVKIADDNTIGVREWFSYAQDKVPLLTKIYFGQEQLVGFSGQGNNFAVLPMGKK